MKNLLALSAIAGALLLGACQKSEVQPAAYTPIEKEPPLTRAKTNDKELKGDMLFRIDETFDYTCDCGSYTSVGTYKGAGQLSHLGTTTSYFKPCIAPLFNGATLVGYHVGVQCGYLEAANGNVVNVSIQPYDLLFTPAGAAGTVNVTITGGTGRFANATGSFTAGTTNDGMGNVTLDNITGTINY